MPIPVRPQPFLPRGCPRRMYAGLARLSPGCPPDRGRLHTCYSPVRRSPAAEHCCSAPLPLDLHVLSLPLAFILSQDQTLRCLSIFFLFQFVCPDSLSIYYQDPLTGNTSSYAMSYLVLTLLQQVSLLCPVASFHCPRRCLLSRSFHHPEFRDSGCKITATFIPMQGFASQQPKNHHITPPKQLIILQIKKC